MKDTFILRDIQKTKFESQPSERVSILFFLIRNFVNRKRAGTIHPFQQPWKFAKWFLTTW